MRHTKIYPEKNGQKKLTSVADPSELKSLCYTYSCMGLRILMQCALDPAKLLITAPFPPLTSIVAPPQSLSPQGLWHMQPKGCHALS